jgi:hypothetical protein
MTNKKAYIEDTKIKGQTCKVYYKDELVILADAKNVTISVK